MSVTVPPQLWFSGWQTSPVELVPIVTEGDVRPLDMPFGEGVFVAAIARALIAREIDIGVHSAKDVPLEEEKDLLIAAYPERADPRDALITRSGGQSLDTLRAGATVGFALCISDPWHDPPPETPS